MHVYNNNNYKGIELLMLSTVKRVPHWSLEEILNEIAKEKNHIIQVLPVGSKPGKHLWYSIQFCTSFFS